MNMKIVFRSCAVLLLLGPAASAQSVWLVDDAPGVGVDFTSIQAAVDAAADGDVIVARSGLYLESVQVTGKSLVLCAELGQALSVNILGTFTVSGLAASQSFVMRGVAVVPQGAAALTAVGCDGPVWIERCNLWGGSGDNSYASTTQADSFPAALVSDCDEVVLAHCTLRGAQGPDLVDQLLQGVTGAGGDALVVELGARVSLFACELLGGDGGSSLVQAPFAGAGGGSGAVLAAGTVLASGCTVRAGAGGAGSSNGAMCAGGGDGGDGLRLPPGSTATLRVHDLSYAPGASGAAGGAACSAGAAGEDVDQDGGTVLALPGAARRLETSTPVREGESVLLWASGAPGEVVVAGLAAAQGDIPLDAFGGTLVIDPSFVLLPLGVVPASGTLLSFVPIGPAASPTTLARSIYVQTAHVDATFALWLGHASALLLLDETL